MKKTIFLAILLGIAGSSFAQTLTTTTTDWNQVWQSGFYQSDRNNSENNPPLTVGKRWYWGINVAHSLNNVNSKRYNGQILFEVNTNILQVPTVYVRSTNEQGDGMWTKLIHSEGIQRINGKLIAKEVEIKVDTGADFVFKPDYNLMPLSEVESFVKENQHLPNIPSEKEMKEYGLNVNDMQIKLLQKIEELTLYVIELKKENEAQNVLIEQLLQAK